MRSRPHAVGAQRESRGQVTSRGHAARGEHGYTGTARGVDHLGHDRERADVAGVAGGIIALGDDHVGTRSDLLLGLTRLADEAPNLHVEFVGALQQKGR